MTFLCIGLLLFIFNTGIAQPSIQFIKESDNIVSLNLAKVPLRDALAWLAKFSHKNIIISQSVQGSVSIYLQHLTWRQAMHAILRAHALGQQQVGNIIYIAPLDEIVAREKQQQQMVAHKPLQTILLRLNYAKATEVAKLLRGKNRNLLTTRGCVTTDERTNGLLVRDTAEQIAIIRKFVKQLDIPMRQVLIETRIVNIDESFEKELGIRFGITQSHHISGTVSGANAIARKTPISEVPVAERLNVDLPALSDSAAHLGIALFKLTKGTLLDLELSALESAGHAKVISNPHLITANRQTATIESGEEIPYQETAGQGATATAFKKALLKLKVTPQITPNNKINLYLQVNQDKRSSQEVLGVPAIDTRHIATQVLIDDGQTIVLGGIYEQTKTNGEERVPFFANLPILGILFRHRKLISNRRELLIFVTPKIIRGW